MKLVVEVKDCQDCPMRYTVRDHGSSMDVCSHDDHNEGLYALTPKNGTPVWCPLSERES